MSFHFPIGILGQVWYLIVSIPDLCTLTYLDVEQIPVMLSFVIQANGVVDVMDERKT